MNTKQIKGKIENLPSDGKTSMEFLVKHLTLLSGYNKVSTDYISDADGNLGRSVKLFKNDIAYLVKIINKNSYLEYSIGVTEETQKANAKMDAANITVLNEPTVEEQPEDGEIDGDTDEVITDEDNDSNPFTAVTLSFTGVIISAAAAVLTRKRKQK